MKHIICSALIILTMLIIGCTGKKEPEKEIEKKEVWTCPMHPEVISDKFGSCPVCFMDLVKKGSEDEQHNSDESSGITLSGKKQILAGVATVKAHEQVLTATVTAYSYLDIAEDAKTIVSSRTQGRIEKLYVAKTGDRVLKGQVLYEIYSTQFIQAQTEFLNALSVVSVQPGIDKPARKKLELLGFTASQIELLANEKTILYTVPVYSPASGTVLEKKVKEGEYVNEGSVLYEVVALDRLWNIAELNEQDVDIVQTGGNVTINYRSFPGLQFNGKVQLVYPVVNTQNRTVKVRIEVINSTGKLKPQMFGETMFSKNYGTGVVVPVTAVLVQGNNTTVWIKTGEKQFEQRVVQLGRKYGTVYHVLSGIESGDEVAVSGGFLIDSESQLQNPNPHQHQ